MKKARTFIFIITLLVSASVLVGCRGGLLEQLLIQKVDKIEDGDFIYNKIDGYEDDYTYRIIGLTERGFQKEEVVFPTEKDGRKVKRLGNTQSDGLRGSTPTNYFVNEDSNVKKVFVPADIELRATKYYSVFPFEKAVFLSVYPNLHRAYEDGTEVTRAKTGDYQEIRVCRKIIVASGYQETFDEYYVGNFIEANIQFELNYEVENLDGLLATYDTELKAYCDKNFISEESYRVRLNRYKHEVSHNEGVYWIDHLEAGRKLKTIPQNPTREGYAFGGWYLDKACETPADLKTVTPNADGSTLFLYAKWDALGENLTIS